MSLLPSAGLINVKLLTNRPSSHSHLPLPVMLGAFSQCQAFLTTPIAQGPDTLVNKEGLIVVVLCFRCDHIHRDSLKEIVNPKLSPWCWFKHVWLSFLHAFLKIILAIRSEWKLGLNKNEKKVEVIWSIWLILYILSLLKSFSSFLWEPDQQLNWLFIENLNIHPRTFLQVHQSKPVCERIIFVSQILSVNWLI